jgi:hypothetical protein
MLYDGFEASSTPHQSQAEQLPALWIYALQTTLLRINPLASQLYFMHTLQAEHRYPTASLILQDSGCREIAAVMRYENTIQSEISPRSLIISRKTERHQRIATVSRLWEPLVYPLAALMAIEDVSDAENIYLPASFLGSARWSSNQIADSLAIAAQPWKRSDESLVLM